MDRVDCSILISTFGDQSWEELARTRAYPSALKQGAREVLCAHEPNGTLASVRNGLAATAKGAWFCYLDADDELAPGYLEAMEEGLSNWPHEQLVLLVPAVQYVDRGDTEFAVVKPACVLNTGRPLYEINRAVIGTLIPRELFHRLGGFRELSALEDWELFLRCEREGAALLDVQGAVYRVFRRSGSRNEQGQKGLYEKIRGEYE